MLTRGKVWEVGEIWGEKQGNYMFSQRSWVIGSSVSRVMNEGAIVVWGDKEKCGNTEPNYLSHR